MKISVKCAVQHICVMLVMMMALSLFLTIPTYAQGAATLTGTVVDDEDGSPLAGANVAVREEGSLDLVDGTATGPDGTFSIDGLAAGDYIVDVRFVGYRSRELPVRLAAGETQELDIRLAVETSSLETVIISASRRQEKVLDAPASISVLGPEDLERSVSTSTVEALRVTPGVDMAQTGIDRREVVLRGFNEAFSGSAYVLTDYRQAAIPSLGVNVHSIMPNMSVDVDRVEVVRGPGSALYGPGVDSGVIHYFTKGPFDEPGTTVSVAGGQQSFLGVQGRHAGTLTENLGYKITGQYARAEEWELDPDNPQDAEEIGSYFVYDDPNDPQLDGRTFATGDFDGDGDPDAQLRRQDDYQKLNVNGLLQYRISPRTTLSLNGGYAQLTGVVQSGIGTLQADGFGYSYGQVRLQSGGLFAQVYLNANQSGTDTYVYGSGDAVIDKGLQWNAQMQYDFLVNSLNTQFIVGGDADLTRPRTEGEILGRNEDNDDINEYGAYAQSSTRLSPKLDLTLALRADYNNIVEDVQLSPRAALVFKPVPQNTFRASYNRSFSSPGTNSNFLDIEARRTTVGGPFSLVFRGLGAADGYTFNTFRQTGVVSSILPVPPSGGTPGPFEFGGPIPSESVPVQPFYNIAVAGLADASPSDLPAPLNALSPAQFQGLVALLQGLAPNVSGTTSGQLGLPGGEAGFRPVSGPVDIDPLQQTTTQTVELGYKGLLGDRLLVAVDGYYEQKEDFIGPLITESPLLFVPGLTGDLQTSLTPVLQGAAAMDPQVQGLLAQLGLSPEEAAGLVANLVGSNFEGNPIGVVQPDQDVLPDDDATEVGGFLSYRNFGTVQYWGVDASVQLVVSDHLDVFANTSIVSDDFFDNEDLDESNESLSVALNAPSFKLKGGFNYRHESGFSFGAAGNFVEGFPVETGPYVGEVDSYFVLDLNAGYRFPTVPGLRLDVTVNNVLNNEHREFVGAPALGMLILGRMTYTLR
jgi:iron complex outermembrane receptor protein